MGTPLGFTFHGSAAHVFHRETGVNLEKFPNREEQTAEDPSEEKVPAAVSAGVGDPFAEV